MPSLHRALSKLYFENWLPRKYGGTWQQRFAWSQANLTRDPQEMEVLRRAMLGDLLRHAAEQAPYYRQLFRQVDVQPEELLEPQRFTDFPILTRTHLRQQLEELVADDADPRTLVRSTTGGSTGTPTPYYHGIEYARHSAVLILRNQLWTGWQPGDAVVKIWGSAYDFHLHESLRLRLDNLLRNETMLPAYGMTAARLASWPPLLRRLHPRLLIGYTNALVALANSGEGLSAAGLRGVVTTAETLFPAQRRLLEQAYGCKVYNRYGCRELSTIAHECAYGTMHINEDWVYVEIVDSHGVPVPAGQIGQIVLTGYFTFGMPFIRYAIEDAGAFAEQETPCLCGCRFRSLPKLEGKLQDLISLPQGGYVSGEFFAGVLRRYPVRQFQVLQPSIDCLQVLLVPADGYCQQDEDEMRRVILDFCPGTTATFQQVDEIPLSVSGKRRLTVSQVSGADSLYR